MRSAAVAAIALAVAALGGCSRTVTLLTYNTFNLFDGVDDGSEYRDYDPGTGRWDATRSRRRLEAVATVIRRACPGGPDVVLLQELENRSVLDELCGRHLRDYPYRVTSGGPAGSVQCAVASRLPIRRAATIDTGTWNERALRPVLEVELDCRGSPLTVLVVHWKSKIGGEARTEPARAAAAKAVSDRLRRLLAESPALDAVVAGDFNRNETGLEAGFIVAGGDRDPHDRPALYDPWSEVALDERGSSVYRGRWQTPDHLLLSAGLFDGSGLSYRTGSFRVMRESFMLQPGTGFPRRDRELVWAYSDHLPLLAELEPARPR